MYHLVCLMVLCGPCASTTSTSWWERALCRQRSPNNCDPQRVPIVTCLSDGFRKRAYGGLSDRRALPTRAPDVSNTFCAGPWARRRWSLKLVALKGSLAPFGHFVCWPGQDAWLGWCFQGGASGFHGGGGSVASGAPPALLRAAIVWLLISHCVAVVFPKCFQCVPLCFHCVSVVFPLCFHCVSIVCPLCFCCVSDVSHCVSIVFPLCFRCVPLCFHCVAVVSPMCVAMLLLCVCCFRLCFHCVSPFVPLGAVSRSRPMALANMS